MNLFAILGILGILILISALENSTYAQIDSISEILFFQTGKLHTADNQFTISDDFSIRHFFNEDIIRISGQTVEGFPYITYSRTNDDEINTYGKIFVSGKFVELVFDENIIENKDELNKQDNLSILVKYSQRVYSNQDVLILIKIFDSEINQSNDFTQNYGTIKDVNIHVDVTDDENMMIFSSNGTTNEMGFYETKFRMPVDKINTYVMTVSASNENSLSSKVFQIIHAGADPSSYK